MHWLYSDFPRAPPGVGLVLLRSVLAVFLVIGGVTRVVSGLEVTGSARGLMLGVALIMLSVAVGVGILTPIVHTTIAIVESIPLILGLQAAGLAAVNDDAWCRSLLLTTIAAALALLGPGAYSLDSRLFGRREIDIGSRFRDE